MSVEILKHEHEMDLELKNKTKMEAVNTNPLLINVVIRNILKYLQLRDVKQCRLISRAWDCESFTGFKKQVCIDLNTSDQIMDFLQYVMWTFYVERHFTDIRFFTENNFHSVPLIEEVHGFFHMCGKYIQNLVLRNKYLVFDGSIELIPEFDISHWITLMANNLVDLTIGGASASHYTRFIVPLDQLSFIKNLSLSHCNLIINIPENRISPAKISLRSVEFYENDERMKEICLNDIINFSKSEEIDICKLGINWTFDMSKDLINAKNVEFQGGQIINWETSTAKMHSVKLETLSKLLSTTKIECKQLEFQRHFPSCAFSSRIDLCVLPKMLEKLTFTLDSHTLAPSKIDLPELRSVRIIPREYELPVPWKELKILKRFSFCWNVLQI